MPPKKKSPAKSKARRGKNVDESGDGSGTSSGTGAVTPPSGSRKRAGSSGRKSSSGDSTDLSTEPFPPKRSRANSRKSSSGDTVLIGDLDLDVGAFPSPPAKKFPSSGANTSTETIDVNDMELDGKDLQPLLKTPVGDKKSGTKGAKDTKKTPGKGSPKKEPSVKKVTFDVSSFSLLPHFPEGSWKDALQGEFEQQYWKDLEGYLQAETKKGVQIFPPSDLIFNAFKLTPLEQVKAVILGQDPYHDDGQACGLSFSVPVSQKVPPSLRNIYKELSTDLPGFSPPDHGDLTSWAQQGVFLLNATLTVEAHKPNSHAKYGWQKFTDNVIRTLSGKSSGVVFILWGNFAHKKEKLIDLSKHRVVKTAHPSGLSWSKFKDCKCFSQANDLLKSMSKQEIDWTL